MVDVPEDFVQMSLLAGKLVTIVGQSLLDIKIQPTDLGAAGLALKYADQIDKGNLATLAKLGPLLLATMESLQMTPKSRAIAARGTSSGKPVNAKFDELRQRRSERANRAKNSHPSAG
jgi:hypothetical protein